MEEVEQKATKMGWMPLEEFKGNPDNWRPAEEFVERGENYVPILKDRVRKLEEDLAIQTKITKDELAKVKKQGYDSAMVDFNKKKKELDNAALDAVEEQDTEKFKEIKEEQENLKPPEKEPENSPIFEEWNAKHKWYGTDTELTMQANAQASVFVQMQETKEPGVKLPEKELYDKVTRVMQTLYPEKFENPHRKEPGEVEASTPPDEKKGNKFSDLPKDAKDQFKRTERRMKEQGREFTKEQFLEYYNEE